MESVKNRKIVITGASKGLGAVCAEKLASLGATLVLIARSDEKLEEVRAGCVDPDSHLCVPADLTNSVELTVAIERAADFLGDIDVVLHVAGGGLGLRQPLLETQEFLELFKLNVAAAAEINRLVVPDMQRRRRGNLVHVGSIASNEAVGSVGYNTVKAGLAAYVRSLGRELAPNNIVVTGILPGGFFAPENAMERLASNKPEVLTKFIEDRLPRGRMGKAEELIPMIALLCSEAASMMAGCLVPIDAGEGKFYC